MLISLCNIKIYFVYSVMSLVFLHVWTALLVIFVLVGMIMVKRLSLVSEETTALKKLDMHNQNVHLEHTTLR